MEKNDFLLFIYKIKKLKMMYEKLSDYAKRYNVTYRTAWNRYKKGKIEGAIEDNTGHIIIPIKESKNETNNVALYARVSSNDRKKSFL
jgi:putative resolvase